MRKFILVFLLLTSSILARDLLAIASNNALSDSSSKRLSDSELSEVVGGLAVSRWNEVRYSIDPTNGSYVLFTKHFISLTQEEKLMGSIRLFANESFYEIRENYLNFLNRMSIGTPTITITYDSLGNNYLIQFALVDKSGRYWHMADTFANKIKSAWLRDVGLADVRMSFANAQRQLRMEGRIR